MPLTYEPISTTTLASSSSTIVFSGIPNTYTDLKIVLFAKGAGVSMLYPAIRLNSDSGANYSITSTYTNGTNSYVSRGSAETLIGNSAIGSDTNFSSYIFNIFNYNLTNRFKTVINRASESDGGSGTAVYTAIGIWKSTSAVTTATLVSTSGGYGAGTIATLYGIKAA